MLFEKPAEICRVVKAHHQSNLSHGIQMGFQQQFCLVQKKPVMIFQRRDTIFRMEQMVKLGGAEIAECCQLGSTEMTSHGILHNLLPNAADCRREANPTGIVLRMLQG